MDGMDGVIDHEEVKRGDHGCVDVASNRLIRLSVSSLF